MADTDGYEGFSTTDFDTTSDFQASTASTASTHESETLKHLELCSDAMQVGTITTDIPELEDPLFSSKVKQLLVSPSSSQRLQIPAYGLLGLRKAAYQRGDVVTTDLTPADNLIYANMQHPWSAFICGQQGAGKSHTMTCLLENALISDGTTGKNPSPMAGAVFHYDKFTSSTAGQFCEAAYLSSDKVKVQVLVSPSNLTAMKQLYQNLPKWPAGSPKPEVIPFLFSEKQLNVANMKTLMNFEEDNKNPPLYMALINKVLKQLALDSGTNSGIEYLKMKAAMVKEGLIEGQSSMLKMRYNLIEWFLKETCPASVLRHAREIEFEPGTVLIVDLSCPFVTQSDACSLFSIFLQIFLGKRDKRPLIVALDEAHKFLTESPSAKSFTEDLISVIRQQRHLAARVVIATQEPTISPQLLDLCNMAVVHRFQSPNWYQVLKKHLAALARTKDDEHSQDDVFRIIVRLKNGEALVFCPQACFDVDGAGDDVELRYLEDGYAKIKIRRKITADGGKSIVASDAKK